MAPAGRTVGSAISAMQAPKQRTAAPAGTAASAVQSTASTTSQPIRRTPGSLTRRPRRLHLVEKSTKQLGFCGPRRWRCPSSSSGIGATNDGSETHPGSGASFDKEYTLRLARAHEENGWDRVLTAYGSRLAPTRRRRRRTSPATPSSCSCCSPTGPNLSIPTFAAKTFATLDQISDGRLTRALHHRRQRPRAAARGRLPHQGRALRPHPGVHPDRQAGVDRATEPFDHEGEHYRFDDFVSDVFPVQQPRPRVSFGGSSAAAYAVGGAEADIYCLWGEPLAETAEQIASVEGGRRRRPGRTEPPQIQVAFRPIIGADRGAGLGEGPRHRRDASSQPRGGRAVTARCAAASGRPAEHRLAAAARHRRAGRPLRPGAVDRHRRRHRRRGQLQRARRHPGDGRRRAARLLDLGVDILSARGYDLLDDAVEFGRQVIPIVREEVAKRDRERGVLAAAS